MKRGLLVLLACLVVLAFAGTAMAAQMSGKVTAVDPASGKLSLNNGTAEAGYDCESGSMIKDVKVGDQVTVDYKEENGKKIATKVSPAAAAAAPKKAPVGC